MMNLSTQTKKINTGRGAEKMSEDPLRFMVSLTGLMEDVGRYKLVCLFLATINVLNMLVPCYRVLWWHYMYCLPGLFLQIPATIVQCLSIFTADNILKFSRKAISMNSTRINFDSGMMKEVKLIRFFSVSLCIVSMLVHLLFLPIVGDEEKFICQYNVVTEWSDGKYYTLYVITVAFLLAINGWHFANLLLGPLYAIFHLKFQLQALNRSVEEINKLNGSDDNLNDVEYQNLIFHKLTQCVKHHLRIKDLSETLLPSLENIPMFIVSVFGLCEVAGFLYLIISKFSPPSNFRMILIICICIFSAVAFCWGGQYLSDESNKFHDLLCEMKWFNWNKKNRQCLLIMLPATAQPMKMSCFGLYDLNRAYLLFIYRVSYSLVAVAMKLR